MDKLNLSALSASAVKSTNDAKRATQLSEDDLDKAIGGVSYVTAALHDNHYNYCSSGTVELLRGACN